MSTISIAVPTHRRAPAIPKLLEQIPEQMKGEITLFLSDEQDEQEYAHLRLKTKVTGADNLRDKLNYIHNYYPVGTKVLQLEDDIQLLEKISGQPKTRPITNLQAICQQAFIKQPTGLWAFGPTANHFFMAEQDKRGLYFAAGYAYGFTSNHDKTLEVTLAYKNDYERTIKYFIKYGSILRIGSTGVATKNYTNPGGLQANATAEKRRQIESECVDALLAEYPYLLRENLNRTSPMRELAFRSPRIHPDECRLRQRRKHAGR